MAYAHRSRRDSGPLRSWSERLLDEPVVPLDTKTVKKAVLNVACLSDSVEDCAYILEALGIDIKEVWS